jgi:hypothetical protein
MVLLGFTCFLWALGTEFDRHWGSLATMNPSPKLMGTLAAAPRRA